MSDFATVRYISILFICVVTSACNAADFEIIIRGGRVVDGTGAPSYTADIGISGGKIRDIGRLKDQKGETEIDATGLIVAPGFVDMMGQTATPMVKDPNTALNLLTQGITTINAGEGSSAAPLSQVDGRQQGWTTMAEYFALIESKGLPVNVVQTVGHTQVRRIVLGETERTPTEEELRRMQALVKEGMEAGAIGVSTALIYPPAIYAQTEEIAALARVAGEYGGRYYTHMRNEGDLLLEAIDEALEIGQSAGAQVHIFHLKAAGRQNWGKMPLAIARIRAARAEGQQVTADIYPYVNNGLGIAALIHPRHFTEGYDRLRNRLSNADLRAEIRKEMESGKTWENWFRHAGHDWNRIIVGQSNLPEYKELDGRSVAAIAEEKQEDPWDVFFKLVRAGAFALPETMTDANKILAMRQNFVSFCTDVGPAGGSRSASHPRAFGSFPRLLSKYVRDLGAISLEQAVAQASAGAANNILAFDRGRISEGLAADVIMFDYEELTDEADFANPRAVSKGMKHVVVGGRLVLHNGVMTEARPGRVLRGPGFKDPTAAYRIRSGKDDSRFTSYDRRIEDFMREHRVPGVSVAVTNKGKVVFARGYGYSDVGNGERVSTKSLFRIASLSKPITAVAILQLCEQELLNLDDPVLKVLDYEDEIEQAGASFDPRWRDITIRQLLEHRGGWDRNKSFDAMFQSIRFAQEQGVDPPADQTTVIRAMFRQKLDFNPGDRYAYSNFGYCLLGRVLEKLTGSTYEDYVKQKVLEPLGITTMRIGATRLKGRAENEVRYYHPDTGQSVFQADVGQTVPHPYGAWNLEAMDSHGAWIASAVDLAKFAAAFDSPADCPILSEDSIKAMYTRPPGAAGHDENGQEKDVYYSLGWSNRVLTSGRLNHWHTGSLPGTATIMIRRHDGKNFVALLNSRVSPSASHLGRAIDSLLHKAANDVNSWPEDE